MWLKRDSFDERHVDTFLSNNVGGKDFSRDVYLFFFDVNRGGLLPLT